MHSKSLASATAPRAMRKNYCAILFRFFSRSLPVANKNKMMALHKPYEILYYDSSLNGFKSSIIGVALAKNSSRLDCEAFVALLQRKKAQAHGDDAFLSPSSRAETLQRPYECATFRHIINISAIGNIDS
jgi:hypothetical protein